jgi:hypothetical protein
VISLEIRGMMLAATRSALSLRIYRDAQVPVDLATGNRDWRK